MVFLYRIKPLVGVPFLLRSGKCILTLMVNPTLLTPILNKRICMDIKNLILHVKNRSLVEEYMGFDDSFWLSQAPHLDKIVDFESVFFDNDFTRDDWRAFIRLLAQKYFTNKSFNISFECEENVQDLISKQSDKLAVDSLVIDEDKSTSLDFTSLDKSLMKLEVLRCRKLESLTLSSSVEGFICMHLQKLNKVFIPENNNLKFFDLYKCNKVMDFSFLKRLNNVVSLYLGGNAHLKNLDFLSDDSKVVILHLSESKLIKDNSTIEKLKKLKYLKELGIAGTQKEWACLRQELPNCFVNGTKLES